MKPATLYRGALIVALTLLVIAFFSQYRTRAAAAEAARFEPASTAGTFVPAGTVIRAVLWDGIAELADAGDPVSAFVSTAVMVDGQDAIPTGTQLIGKVEHIWVRNKEATVGLQFSLLIIRGQELTVETEPVITETFLKSDVKILAAALRTTFGVTIGGAMGAVSGDERLMARGIRMGIAAGAPGPTLPPSPIAVVLVQPLVIHR